MREDDYEPEFKNEFQAAFALSKMEFDNGSSAIKPLVDEGKWCLVRAVQVCCPFTDAVLGDHYSLVSTHETFETLHSAWEKAPFSEWENFELWGPPRITSGPVHSVVETDDVPF